MNTTARDAGQEENAMGREQADADAERREIISTGDRIVADALLDGAQEYGRYDAASAQYVEAAAEGDQCSSCIFYRGDTYAGPEGCTIVAATVAPAGGCRFHIAGELPPDPEDEAYVDPTTGQVMAEPAPATLAEAQDELDDALQLSDMDEDDDDPYAAAGISLTVNIDIDNGENHNAEGGGIAAAEGDVEVTSGRSHEIHTAREARAEWRESGAGDQFRTLQGYAALFDSPSEDLGGFREVLAPGCFTRAIASPDLNCSLLWNHDPDSVFASTRNGTLKLKEDDKGLRIWARVDMEDPDARRVVGKIRSGLVDQMSFAFTIAEDGDDWEVRDGKPWRTVRQVEALWDCSAVTVPAYSSTKIEVLERAQRSGRVPQMARASVAQDDPAGNASSLDTEGEALQLLRAKARTRLAIVKFDLSR